MSSTPWLTVITVVKDATADFARTSASLAAQDLTSVEYIVIDSSDDRIGIPGVLAGIPALASTSVTWVEPAGIYAAMNAGLAMARGEYVYFANAGDVLFSSETLARVQEVLTTAEPSGTGAAWAFGPVEILSQDGTRVITPRWNCLLYTSPSPRDS